MDIRERIEALCEGLNQVTRAYFADMGYSWEETYSCDWLGRKYLRIVRQGTNQRFVECFVERATGDVYKGGWKAPEPPKVARFNIASDDGLQRLLAHKWMSEHGWLYMDHIKATDDLIREAQTKTILSLLSPVWL